MALPGRLNVTADLHVCGHAARIIALQEAVRFHTNGYLEAGKDDAPVLETAEKFTTFLETDAEQDQ